MKIEKIKIDKLKEYAGNAKKHPKEQIDQIAKSIFEFGFNDPIAVDENNMIIEGHGRLYAAKELGIDSVPCIRLTSLSEQQKKAYILAHNKLTMNSDFELEVLSRELESIIEFDMQEFGFDIDILDEYDDEVDWQEKTDDRVENMHNLGIADFQGQGKYNIPTLLPETKMPKVKEWIPFNYVMSDKNPKGKGVHFFIHDYQFERVWSNPEAYLEKLKQYECVLAPDFSPYWDMPLALNIFNHYRKMWCACYWQLNGIKVIPVVRGREEDKEWCYEGVPRNSIIAISTLADKDEHLTIHEHEIKTLNPSKILIYSNKVSEDKLKSLGVPCEVINGFCKSQYKSKGE